MRTHLALENRYERPDSENEMLGLNQMDTEECDRAEKQGDE
jgi:hypothetical protein